jgi:DEAD/DEAH box helicase domain-containing protein
MRQVAQLLLMCDGHDIGISIDSGETDTAAGQASGPQRIFVYDNYPGGIGSSAPLFDMHAELLAATRKLIAECECENGCPGCVGPIGNTGPLAKAAALRILDLLLERRLGIPETASA